MVLKTSALIYGFLLYLNPVKVQCYRIAHVHNYYSIRSTTILWKILYLILFVHINVDRQQPRSARLRPIQKIPTPIKLLISPLPEMINQICKKYSLENSQDKKTSDDTCDIFSDVTPENELINSLPV